MQIPERERQNENTCIYPKTLLNKEEYFSFS